MGHTSKEGPILFNQHLFFMVNGLCFSKTSVFLSMWFHICKSHLERAGLQSEQYFTAGPVTCGAVVVFSASSVVQTSPVWTLLPGTWSRLRWSRHGPWWSAAGVLVPRWGTAAWSHCAQISGCHSNTTSTRPPGQLIQPIILTMFPPLKFAQFSSLPESQHLGRGSGLMLMLSRLITEPSVEINSRTPAEGTSQQ